MIVFPEPDGLYRERLKMAAATADQQKLLQAIISVLGPLELNLVGELVDLPRATVQAEDFLHVEPVRATG